MKNRIWHLPWTAADVPHALVDINRGCNVTCRSCYNTQPAIAKPVDDIKRDFETLMQMRKLDSVSIVGGEILMHPDLSDIVSYIRSKDIHVELFTNGLLLRFISWPATRSISSRGRSAPTCRPMPHLRICAA